MITDLNFWLFLVISVPVFWAIPKQYRMGFLAAISFAYLLSLEFTGGIVLLAWSLCFYYLVPLIKGSPSAKWFMPILLMSILGYLAYFKYVPRILSAFSDEPILQKFIIPLGISFYTFKLVHYAVEVKRGNITAHSLQDFLCYIFLMPIFSAGPIERFDHFQNNREEKWRLEFAVEGVTRIMHGLIKKLVLGNLLLLPLYGDVSDGATLLENLDELSTLQVWGFCVLSFLFIYLDFSAYSDIAIGASRLYGLRIMENFNWPILAENISIFWKRWHMTLAGWCQCYIYMPIIGLTRNPYLATYLTFCAIGLWHSGSLGWLAWGMYHATGISIFGSWNRYRRRRKWRGLDRPYYRWISIVITFAFVSAGSILTSLDGIGSLHEMFRVYGKLVFLNIPA